MSKHTFKGYDDFVPAFNEARGKAIELYGEHWHLVTQLIGTVPSCWVTAKVFGRTSKAPRDQHFPPAIFWPNGELPKGPVYREI